ncbi:ferredoxin reductase-like protein, partial [Exidia glandulosa HHB12029]
YTPVSRRDSVGSIEFLIKLYMPNDKYPSGGKMSAALSKLVVGDEVELKGPLGSFIWEGDGHTIYRGMRSKCREIGMICAGSGITPIIQVLRAILRDSSDTSTRAWMIYANRTEEDILLRDELDAFHREGHQRFAIHHTLSNPSTEWKGGSLGRINESMVREYLPPPSKDGLILACGPEEMMNLTVRPALKLCGWDVEAQLVIF